MIETHTAPQFEEMRHLMVVSQLRTSAVSDPRVVKVMAEVPRERFVPEAARAVAYNDRQIPLGNGRALSPPLATGRLLVAAEITPADRVLLVGAATGYTAAVLARLAGLVTAVESDPALLAQARTALADVAAVKLVEGPLAAGWADDAPYDVLVIDGAVESVPAALVEQVAVDGRVATGIVDRAVTRLAAGRRTAGGFGLVDFADIDCAVLPGFARPKTFQF